MLLKNGGLGAAMKSLKEYTKKREWRQTGGMPESAGFHSKGYRRYFEGYSEYLVEKPNGRRKIERVYTGVYHKQELNHMQRIWIRTFYCISFGMSLLLFLFCATRNVPSNYSWYVATAEAVSTASLFWTLCCLFHYMTAGENMTLYEYHCVDKLKKAVKWTSGALFGISVTTAIYILLHMKEDISGELACLVSALGASGMCMEIYMAEKKIRYASFLSPNKAPEQSNQIDL
ncbi:hypothetical protein D5281_09700 [bacterium 1xD42-62]|uniref:Uncharacterized protein n=2 Tax=Parablautia muri TaxID=2320879 RepID=A0A9X5BF38_9FIRM|nr:hypothetical protein [Parablautia muri]